MNQIVAISSKHSPELSLNFWIQRDSVNDGAVNVVLSSPISDQIPRRGMGHRYRADFRVGSFSTPRSPRDSPRTRGTARTTSLAETRRNTNCSVIAIEEERP